MGQRKRDPELNYCPRCDDEYRSDMSVCADCGVALVSGREKIAGEEGAALKKEPRSMELSADDDLVNIRKGPLLEMKKMQQLLASEQIPSLIAGEKSGNCGKGCCGVELYLQIKRDDGDLALAVLARDFHRSTALDHHDLTHVESVYDQGVSKTVCPACGCRFSTNNTTCPDCGLCFSG
jgi:predicted amidophosphoribosyltransferase